MGDSDKLVKVVKLMAKTGLYFAHCDGHYNQSEKDFLEAYVSGIELIGSIDDDVKQSIYSTFDNTYTLKEIVSETEEVLNGLSAKEQEIILLEIDKFIKKVIHVDDKVESKEQFEYRKWKEALGLS